MSQCPRAVGLPRSLHPSHRTKRPNAPPYASKEHAATPPCTLPPTAARRTSKHARNVRRAACTPPTVASPCRSFTPARFQNVREYYLDAARALGHHVSNTRVRPRWRCPLTLALAPTHCLAPSPSPPHVLKTCRGIVLTSLQRRTHPGPPCVEHALEVRACALAHPSPYPAAPSPCMLSERADISFWRLYATARVLCHRVSRIYVWLHWWRLLVLSPTHCLTQSLPYPRTF